MDVGWLPREPDGLDNESRGHEKTTLSGTPVFPAAPLCPAHDR